MERLEQQISFYESAPNDGASRHVDFKEVVDPLAQCDQDLEKQEVISDEEYDESRACVLTPDDELADSFGAFVDEIDNNNLIPIKDDNSTSSIEPNKRKASNERFMPNHKQQEIIDEYIIMSEKLFDMRRSGSEVYSSRRIRQTLNDALGLGSIERDKLPIVVHVRIVELVSEVKSIYESAFPNLTVRQRALYRYRLDRLETIAEMPQLTGKAKNMHVMMAMLASAVNLHKKMQAAVIVSRKSKPLSIKE
jgi:hypothetical protein